MKVRYGEGVAIHTGPEPCGAAREDGSEASAGERIGQPLSREGRRQGLRPRVHTGLAVTGGCLSLSNPGGAAASGARPELPVNQRFRHGSGEHEKPVFRASNRAATLGRHQRAGVSITHGLRHKTTHRCRVLFRRCCVLGR